VALTLFLFLAWRGGAWCAPWVRRFSLPFPRRTGLPITFSFRSVFFSFRAIEVLSFFWRLCLDPAVSTRPLALSLTACALPDAVFLSIFGDWRDVLPGHLIQFSWRRNLPDDHGQPLLPPCRHSLPF